MRMNLILLCIISLTSSLCGCTSNVVPQKGATMEQIYDSVGRERYRELNRRPINSKPILLKRQVVNVPVKHITANRVESDFRKLPNPELSIYVFPHLAGNDDVPIPGYVTVFNVYEHDHYLLQNQWFRG